LCFSSIQVVFAQEKGKKEPEQKQKKEETIPLDHFYVDRLGPGALRKLLSKLNFGLSTGLGLTTFKHSLDGYGIYQPATGAPIIFDPTNPAVGFTNWFNQIESGALAINPADFSVNSDTADIGFKSKSFNIPLRATIHVGIKNRFRVGGGFSFEFTKVGDFKPISYTNDINSFSPDVSSFFLKKYFLILGASVYRYQEYVLTVDANIGGYGLGKNFDKSQITKGVFVNVGAMIEREMSEYFRLFVRPSYEIKSYTLDVAETGMSIKHKFNAFYFNVGASYRIPELRRCFQKQCRAQINHAHGNKEYRSRAHPIYKKQNPHHGENYPELIKYKGKNKRKLNPY
jgi:hypothetical protein